MVSICHRCGARLSSEEVNCSVCGLNREGGKGIIKLENERIPINRNLHSRSPDIFDRIRNHKITNSLTDEKLHSEKERIKKEIEKIDKKILANLKNPPLLHVFAEQRRLKEQLEAIYHYIVLRDKVEMIDKISKYYDLEDLTLDKVKDEIPRLIKEIRDVEGVLIFMEKDEPIHPDKMVFYERRNAIRDQLDTLHDYKELLEMETTLDNMRDSKLGSIYGRLPDWRLEEKRSR